MSSPLRRRDEDGQSLVEFALVLPLVILIVAVAFNGWDGMQESIRLTSAARAAAIRAASDLASNVPQSTLLDDVTKAVNQEENTTVYQHNSSGAPDFVNVSTNQTTITDTQTSFPMSTVTVTITPNPVTLIPFVGKISVTASATARYS